ncbi:MAG: YchJ family protein [Vibrio sp.]
MSAPLCPCGQGQPYANCCQPIHQNPQQAAKPHQLMQARYSAHVLGLVDFIIHTYHPSLQAQLDPQEILESTQCEWQALHIIHQSRVIQNQGFVEFKAFFKDDDQELCMHEKSRFVFENNQWFYVDGEMDPMPEMLNQTIGSFKPKRNDPCFCGSGKKFKKCCG